jgi:RNA recognition motif-containing protein
MANIYVGNLPYSATREEIQQLFQAYGQVKYVKIVTDPGTGRSKGFGFVDMDSGAAVKAIAALHDTELAGRKIQVNVARPPARPMR